jgi:uncharacterized protein YjbI with pentapeptide repeats
LDTTDVNPQPPAQAQLILPRWGPDGELMPLEEEVRAKAAAGELADHGAGPFNLAEMQTWGEERAVRAEVLRYLLTGDKWPVDAKGVRLRGVRVVGHLDLDAATLRCPLSVDCCYLDASEPVCLDHATVSRLTLTRCHMAGLTGLMLSARQVDLSGSTLTGPLLVVGADIAGQLFCRGVQLTGCNQDGCALYARGIKVGGDAYLDEGFTACGAVRLTRADIAGTLSCKGAKLSGNEQDRYALYARGIKVGGDVSLDEGFTADGAVGLTMADVTGAVSCSGAQLTGVDENGDGLVADGIKVGGDVIFDKMFIAGPVRLLGADITKRLSCRTALLTGCDENRNALHGERMKVGGDVWFDKAFIASGAVCLLSADITGQLSCYGAWLTGRDKDGNALHGEGIKVGGDVCLDAGFIADGTISLASAHAGTLRWAPAGPVFGQVNLEGASVGELRDDWTREPTNGYWPTGGQLRLDGFTYGRFGGDHQADVKQRLAWIRSQYKQKPKPTVPWSEAFAALVTTPTPKSTENFAAQPYEQLAAVYRQAGQDSQARKVAIARRADLRKYGNLNWYRRFGNWFLDTTIRYGYQTWRAAVALAVLFLIFVLLSALAQQNHLITPVGNTEGLHFVPSATRCTSSYPCFYPVGYAVDTVIPIINVHQADNWGPDGSTPWGEAFMVATWIWTGLGWALATLLVAGYTGLVRQE